MESAPLVIEFDTTPESPSGTGLTRLATDALVRLMKMDSKRAVIPMTPETEAPIRLLGRMIKRVVPDVNLEYRGPVSDLEGMIHDLKSGSVDRVVRTQSDPRGANILYKGSDGIIRWEEPVVDSQADRTLLIFMPAWINQFPPFGLAHIAGALRTAGHATDVLDLNWHFWRNMRARFEDLSEFGNVPLWCNRESYEHSARPHLEDVFSVLREKIVSGRYRYFGFSLLDPNLNASEDAFALIRELAPTAKIFCGGPTCLPQWSEGALAQGRIDAAVFGEGEVSVVELLSRFKSGGNAPVAGVQLRREGGGIEKGSSRPLANLNQLPKPDFSGFHLYNYDDLMLPVHFGRGCVASCAFCAETRYWVRFRILTPETLVAHIQNAISLYGIRNFQFNDSLMNGSHRHLEKFVDKILELGINIRFSGYCRLDADLTGDLLRKMARAGCRAISFGMESGSQKVTDLMRKEVDVRNYERIVREAHEAGVLVIVCVIVGFPGETWWDFMKTARMLFRLRNCIHMLNLSMMGLSTNSLISENLEAFGVHMEGDDWKTKDGKNTPRVRKVRWWLLNRFWRLARQRQTSPFGWTYQK